MSVFGVVLVRIFPHSDQTNSEYEHISAVMIMHYYFPGFWQNAEKYSVSLHVQSKRGKIRARITPITNTFHAVHHIQLFVLYSGGIIFKQ